MNKPIEIQTAYPFALAALKGTAEVTKTELRETPL